MATYKRILLKLSGESLMGEKQYGIDEKRLADMQRKLRKSMNWAYRLASLSAAGTSSAD